MAQLINFRPRKFNSTQDLFMLVGDHSWRDMLCRLETGCQRGRWWRWKWNCPNANFLLRMLARVKRSYIMMYRDCAVSPLNSHPSIFETWKYILFYYIYLRESQPPQRKEKALLTKLSMCVAGEKKIKSIYITKEVVSVRTFFLKLF